MEKLKTKVLVTISAAVILIFVFAGGFVYGRKFPKNLVITGASNIEPAVSSTADFGVFWEAWQKLNDNFINNAKITGQQKLYGAITGLVGSLNDPYTQFFSPSDGKKFQEDVKGNFGGIGAEIGVQKGQLTVVAPLKDSPAEKAGLKSGDKILQINSSSTYEIAVDEAVSVIRGEIGTVVTLTISREGWAKPKEIKITRGKVIVPTVDSKLIGNIAHIELHGFNENSNKLFFEAMNDGLSKGAKGLVLDLRDDPGGYLDVAVEMAGWFLPKGSLVVKEESKIRPTQEFKTDQDGQLKDFPMVVLVNGGSASASEILAGALRDVRKVKLVGEKTFGKGTVQELISLSDSSMMKITVAHWVTPLGIILESEGLKPDFEVKLTDEDIIAKRDPQLDKAIEVLKKEITGK